jgi:hypothetical protein
LGKKNNGFSATGAAEGSAIDVTFTDELTAFSELAWRK